MLFKPDINQDLSDNILQFSKIEICQNNKKKKTGKYIPGKVGQSFQR